MHKAHIMSSKPVSLNFLTLHFEAYSPVNMQLPQYHINQLLGFSEMLYYFNIIYSNLPQIHIFIYNILSNTQIKLYHSQEKNKLH